MVIDFNRPNNPGPVGGGRSNAAQGSERATGTPRSGTTEASTESELVPTASIGDSVQLSPEAQQLQQVTEKLRDMPSTDEERIAKLRQAIADGSYQVDSKRLAAKLVAFETQDGQ